MPTIATKIPLLLVLTLCACTRPLPHGKPIERLDQLLASDTAALTARQTMAYQQWAAISEAPPSRSDYAATEAVRVFSRDIARYLPPLDSIERVLGAVDGIDTLSLYGLIIPFNQSIVTTPDSTVYIGLNHYLGPDYPGYSAAVPPYLLHRKGYAMMAVDIVHAVLVRKYPPQFGPLPTLLQRLQYQGAILLATAQATGASDAAVLGMTPEQLADTKANEARMWQRAVERKLLYSTIQADADRLLRPSPASTLISPDAPGQAILYIALQMARAHQQQTGISPQQFLQQTLYNSNQTLIDSKYAPVRK